MTVINTANKATAIVAVPSVLVLGTAITLIAVVSAPVAIIALSALAIASAIILLTASFSRAFTTGGNGDASAYWTKFKQLAPIASNFVLAFVIGILATVILA